MQINQILPTISYGDAISNNAFSIRDTINSLGYETRIFANNINKRIENKVEYYKKYKGDKDNILIIHFSIGDKIYDFVKDLPDKKILIYHNVTPPEYMENINENIKLLLKKAKEHILYFRDKDILILADSIYNIKELKNLGFNNVKELPIIINFDKYKKLINKKLYHKYNDDYKNFLFVG